jgi:iron complex outermembrane receptor protein
MNLSMHIAVAGLAVALVFVDGVALAQGSPETTQAAGSNEVPAAGPGSELPTIPVSPLAEAAPTTTREPEARPGRAIEEVIVTAQRREERAQDVPISMTVFSQEQISNANMSSADDLAKYTPSLTSNSAFGKDNSSFSIRGFTQAPRTTASVGTYFAEVVAPRGQSIQPSGDGAGPGSLFDLQNVQVLKGPQGTLFGRNTTGGAVLLVPKKPTDEFEGFVETTGGNYGSFRGLAVVNAPVTDWFKLRFGIDSNKRDGYLRNVSGVGADRDGDVDYTAVRVSAVVNVTSDIENYTIVSFVDSDNHGYPGRLFACNPDLNPLNNPFYAIVFPQCQAQLARQKAAGQNGFYDVNSTLKTSKSANKERRLINTTTWIVNDDFSVKNIAGYAHLKTQSGQSIFGSQWSDLLDPRRDFTLGLSVVSPDVPVTSQETFVEEFRFQGKALDGQLDWQAGVYYENSRPDGYSGNNAAVLISCDMATLEGDPSQYNCNDVTAGILGAVNNIRIKTDYLNKAVYGQATYTFLEKWKITTGLRYTKDDTHGSVDVTHHTFITSLPSRTTQIQNAAATTTQAPTGLVDLSYHPTEDALIYAKYVRGYRQGAVVPGVDPGLDTYDAEHVNTYEIGTKTEFHGVVPGIFNVSAFYNDFRNLQLQGGYVSSNFGPTLAIFNTGRARIAGVEAEVTLRPLRPVQLNFSYAHLDTKLLSAEDRSSEVMAAAGLVASLTYAPLADVGDSLPYSADDSFVGSLSYLLPVPQNIGSIDFGMTYVYTGHIRSAASSASPYSLLDPTSLLNVNLNWARMFGSPLDFALFGTNLLDKHYVSAITGTYSVAGFESRQMGQPRMFGARLRYNFGASGA